MKLLGLLVFCSSFALANSCAEVSTSPTTPLPSGSASTWTSCGGTVPQTGDSVAVGYLLQRNSNLPASGSLASFTVSGTNAQVSWDGHSHTVSVTGQIVMTNGCLVTGADCPTPYSWDDCTTPPTTATATGSASSGSTALTLSNIVGTPENGMLVYGGGVAPGSTMTGSGTSWTLSLNTLSAVSGPLYFVATTTFTATGLTSSQGIFSSSAPSAPAYTSYGQVCNFLGQPGTSGAMFVDSGQFGVAPSPDLWTFKNGIIYGGITPFPDVLSNLVTDNITVLNNSGEIWSGGASPTVTATASGTSASKTLVVSDVYQMATGQAISSTHLPTATASGTAAVGSFILNVANVVGTILPGQRVTCAGTAFQSTVASVSGSVVTLSARTVTQITPTPLPIAAPQPNCAFAVTITSTAIYPGTSITVSSFPTGTMTTETVSFTQYVSFQNTTWLGYTASNAAFVDLYAYTPVYVDGMVILGDTAAMLTPSAFNGSSGPGVGAGAGLSNSLIHAYSPGTGPANGCVAKNLTSGVFPVYNSAIDGCYQDLKPGNFMVSAFNFYAQSCGQNFNSQGIWESQGSGNPFFSRGDILVNDCNTSLGGWLAFLFLNSASGITATSPQVDLGNMTVVMTQSNTANPSAIILGEYSAGTSYPMQNAALHDSIVVGNYNGVNCADPVSTFATIGTGGAGLFNNDVYNYGLVGYVEHSAACSTNGFGTGHPSATYGDLSNVNPVFSGTTQYPSNPDTRWALADAALGGPGTVQNMFDTVMAGRSSGQVPAYTPSQVVAKLRAPYAPTAAAIKTAGSAYAIVPGGYIGAMAPSNAVPSSMNQVQ